MVTGSTENVVHAISGTTKAPKTKKPCKFFWQHEWSKWEQNLREKYHYDLISREKIPMCVVTQEKVCLRCGKLVIKVIKE